MQLIIILIPLQGLPALTLRFDALVKALRAEFPDSPARVTYAPDAAIMAEEKPQDLMVDSHAAMDSEKARESESIEQGEVYFSKISVWLNLIFLSVATGSDS